MKPIKMPAPSAAARPTRKVCPVSPVAKAAANTGASVETEPSISPASPGCTQVSTKRRRSSASSAASASGVSWRSLSAPARDVPTLGRGEVAQERTGARVGRAAGGLEVEALGAALHRGGAAANLLEPQGPGEPVGLAHRVAPRLLAPDERDDLAEAPAVEGYELGAVAVLLARHALEHGGRGGMILPQPLRVGAVDAPVLLLGADRESEDLALAQRGERAPTEAPERAEGHRAAREGAGLGLRDPPAAGPGFRAAALSPAPRSR